MRIASIHSARALASQYVCAALKENYYYWLVVVAGAEMHYHVLMFSPFR